nr:reverse transcriptase domain-containing protein [Tanacetum cinerariifolium]
MIHAIRINVPFVDVLAGMPNYGKFLNELISNKHKIKQIFAAFLSYESLAMIQNKVPPKFEDPESFLIPCNFNITFSCNALADLGASINLMPYSLYAKLSLKTLKPTKMSVILADRSFQYPVGIAENMLIEVGKFTFPANFVILKMKEDSKKQSNLGVRTERMIFNIDSATKHSYLNDDTCFSMDVIDEILEEDFEPTFEKITINTKYKIKTTLEEPPVDLKLKPLPDNLEYVFLEEPSFLPVIISSQLSKEKINKLVSILKKDKQAFAWKTTDIPGIFPDAHLVLNWEKCHFMVKEGIVLGHKDTTFEFDDECQKAFELLKEKLTCAPVIVIPNWNLLFELMCDVSDFAVGTVLGQKDEIKDRKGTKNVTADHLSRIENDESSDDSEVDDNFPGETLMKINTKDEPWFVDFANNL